MDQNLDLRFRAPKKGDAGLPEDLEKSGHFLQQLTVKQPSTLIWWDLPITSISNPLTKQTLQSHDRLAADPLREPVPLQ